jgi:hypothetical protein
MAAEPVPHHSSNGAHGLNGHHEYLEKDYDEGAALSKIRTAGSISISPELFEKLYLSPENRVKDKSRFAFYDQKLT